MTPQALRGLPHAPPVPFVLDLGAGRSRVASMRGVSDPPVIEVTAVLRWLPGRRLAAAARLDGRPVFLKCLFGGYRARRQAARELRGSQFIAAAGLRTPACVLDRVVPGGRVLAFEWVADARALDPEQPVELEAMIHALHALYRAGFRHLDPHGGNILQGAPMPGDAAAQRLILIDAGSVRRRLSPPVFERVLARVFARAFGGDFAREFARESARVRAQRSVPAALSAAWTAAGVLAGPAVGLDPLSAPPSAAKAMTQSIIDPAEARARRQRVRRLLRKTLRNATAFMRLDRPGVRVHVVREPTAAGGLPAVPAWLLDDPEQAMARGVVIKAGRTATVVRQNGDPGLIIKRYNNKSHWHALRRSLAPRSRACWAWLNGHRLALLGIPAARPLALIETRQRGIRGPSYLVMADVGTDDLAACIARDQVTPALAERIAGLLAALAAADLAHRDLKASNVVIDAGGIPHLIDLDALRERRGGDPRDRARLLANGPGQPISASMQRLRDALLNTGDRRRSGAS